MRLIVGLGNPGPEYAWTPHNLGFLVVERLGAQLYKLPEPPRLRGRMLDYLRWMRQPSRPIFRERIGHSYVVRGQFAGQDVVLAKPQTYMNASGEAVRELVEGFGIPTTEMIIVFDDIALPWGFIRIREHGSAGGHKGVESVLSSLGTDRFVRVRVGIQPYHAVRDLSRYVLSRIPSQGPLAEEAALGTQTAIEAIEVVLREGTQSAMAKYNKKIPLNQ